MLVCVTHRHSCREDFLVRMERVAAAAPDLVILREKDLDTRAYTSLLRDCLALCTRYGVALAVHSHEGLARACSLPLHLPFPLFEQCAGTLAGIPRVGVSVHSVREAAFARENGADYVTAGHIYATGCKPGLAQRGLGFLQEVCEAAAPTPVLAIGGIRPGRIVETAQAGAAGVCLMSEWMTCDHPSLLAEECRAAMKQARHCGKVGID